MVYREVLVKLLNYYVLRYIFFLQISTFLPFIKLILLKCGDIETYPGSDNLIDQNLSLCHWNLNEIATYFVRISLLGSHTNDEMKVLDKS